MADLPRGELEAIARAKFILENPSLAIRISDRIGAPVEGLVRRLPVAAQRLVTHRTRKALESSLEVALRTLDPWRTGPASDWLHRGVVVASGALGGAAGLPGFLLELPFSLAVMLRSIADHARAQGEDLTAVAARLECLAVFAYGTRSPADDAADSAYFAVRTTLGRAVSQAAEFVAERGVADALGEQGAPALLHLITRIAPRLGVSLTDKAAAELVPLVGAAGGAAINALFIQHYQDTAWAHFTIRRLERANGEDAVRRAYQRA